MSDRPARPYAASLVVGLTLGLALLGLTAWMSRAEARNARAYVHGAAGHSALRLEDFVASRIAIVSSIARERSAGLLDQPGEFRRRGTITTQTFGGLLAINDLDAEGVIREVSPLEPNQRALGRSVFDHPTAAPYARESERTRQPVVTHPIELFQGVTGVASYIPVVRDGELRGFVNGVFDCGALVRDGLRDDVLSRYVVRVTDLSPPAGQSGVAFESEGFADARTTDFVGVDFAFQRRTWRLELAPGPVLHASLHRATWRTVAVVGVMLIVLLSMLVHAVQIRTLAERRAEAERTRLAALVAQSADLHAMVTADGRLKYLNRAGRRLLGIAEEGPLMTPGGNLANARAFIPEGEDRRLYAEARRLVLEQGTWTGEMRVQNIRTGRRFPLELAITSRGAAAKAGGEVALIVSGRDVGERQRLESELAHAQKMEALGQLAGGVAHDFNNLLTIILSQLQVANDKPAYREQALEMAGSAARRGADLTRNLLRFARRRVPEWGNTNVVEELRRLEPVVRQLVRESVALRLEVDDRLDHVPLHPADFERVVLNLVNNAAQAMPRGGELSLRAFPAGARTVIEVADTGVGMDADVRNKVFDPFFTTRSEQGGTGLGLASVFGTVTQAGGTVELESEVGTGTTVRFSLPTVSESADASGEVDVPPVAAGEVQTVLFAEDDDEVRAAVCAALGTAGFEVRAAEGGEAALALLGDDVDVLLTDVVMPGISGPDLARAVRARRPDIPVVFCSGYVAEKLDPTALDTLSAAFIAKPFGAEELRRAIEESRRRLAAAAAEATP